MFGKIGSKQSVCVKTWFLLGNLGLWLIYKMRGDRKLYLRRKKSLNIFLKAIVAGAMLTFFAAQVQPAFAGGLLNKIKKEKKLVVATEAAYPPMEFVKDGKIVGLGKDVLDIIVADLGVELIQHDLPFQGIIPGLLAKKFDFVATSMSITEERAKKVAYTLPLIIDYNEVAVRSQNKDIKSPWDLNGKIVGTQLASSNQEYAEKFNEELKAKGGSGFKELRLYTAFPEIMMAMMNKQIDASSFPTIILATFNKKRPGILKSVGRVGPTDPLCWITLPEDLDVRDYLNSMILKLRDSGKLYELQMKWLGTKIEIQDSGYLPPGAF